MMAVSTELGGATRSAGWLSRAMGIVTMCGALGSLSACLTAARGDFATTAYTSTYGYEIPYEPGSKLVLPVEWALDNYRIERGERRRKDQAPYVTQYEFDDDGDGETDTSFDSYTYALRYEHRVHAGAIWLREIPIAQKLRDKDLRVLLQTYLDEIAGATYETVKLGASSKRKDPSLNIVVERRHAPSVIEQGPVTVGGQPGYAATFDLANIDEVTVSPRARSLRVQIVVMRAPKSEIYKSLKSPIQRNYPVILLAGYSNMPTDFSKGLGDFHGLLRRMSFAGRSGLTLDLAPTAPSPAASPAVRAPAAASPAAASPAVQAPAVPAPGTPSPR